MKKLGILLLIVGFGWLLVGAQPPANTCRVLVIYDGDTLGCDVNGNGRVDGKAEQVRLIGIDAPEMHYSRKNHTGRDQPGAVAAKQFLTQQVLNKPVRLVQDKRPRDKYGRMLAYVYASNATVSVNETLLRKGLAGLLFIPPNMALQPRFQQAASGH
jgi:micrococcal nuclease